MVDTLHCPAGHMPIRYRVEATVVLLYTAWLAVRLAMAGTLETVTILLLVAVVAPLVYDVFLRGTKINEHQSLVLVPVGNCRPMCDDGLANGLLLVPLVVGATLACLKDEWLHLNQSLLMSVIVTLHVQLCKVKDRFGSPSFLTVFGIAAAVQASLIGLWHYADSLSWATYVQSNIACAGFQLLLHVFLLKFPKSFSVGEASIVSQLVVLLGADALAASAFRFRVLKPMAFMNLSRSPIHLFLQSLILGMVMIGILLAPFLVKLRQLAIKSRKSMQQEYSREAIVWSLMFFAGVLAIIFVIISPWMRYFLHTDPFWWTFSFLMEGWRLHFVVYWALAIIISVTVLSWRTMAMNKAQSEASANGNGAAQPSTARLPLILVRKYFHLLAVAMFAPGLLIEPYLLQLAFGVALSLLVFAEYIRLCDVYPFGKAIRFFMESFIDHRDAGPLVLSHIYLLLGCAIPMWISPVPFASFFAPFSGIVTIGIGDTMASIVGIYLGRIKWPQTSKTVEGTLAGILSCVVFSFILSAWCPAHLALTGWQLVMYFFALALAGLMEAHTQQIDNLTVPLYLFSSVLML